MILHYEYVYGLNDEEREVDIKISNSELSRFIKEEVKIKDMLTFVNEYIDEKDLNDVLEAQEVPDVISLLNREGDEKFIKIMIEEFEEEFKEYYQLELEDFFSYDIQEAVENNDYNIVQARAGFLDY